MGNRRELLRVRLHGNHLHHQPVFDILIVSELFHVYLRDLGKRLVQTGQKLTHDGRQALWVFLHLVEQLMQVHGDGGIAAFGPDGESHVGLPLQLLHLLDAHVRFRMTGLRSILRDIKEIFITHRHSSVPP